MKRFVMLAALVAAGGLQAQSEEDVQPGERPPARSISDAAVNSYTGVPGLSERGGASTPSNDVLIESTPPKDEKVAPPAVSATEIPRIVSQRVEPPRTARAVVDIKPPPAKIDAEPGQNYVFGIATAHLNRIITPFADPMIKTTSMASISTDKGIIYVSTQMREPIAMFVHDSVDPEIAISLTLMPSDIPPVSTTLEIKGYAKAQRYGVPRVPEAAQSFESSDDYVATLSTIMSDLALQRLPEGYGLMPIQGYPALMPECRWPGVDVAPKQMLSGTAFTVFVALARNVGSREIALDEAACAEGHVRAVSTWPRSSIAPGEETEVYVVVSSTEEEAPEAVRPSLLGGAL